MTKGYARTLSASALAVAVTTQALAGSGGAKKDPALNGVTMLPQAAVNQRYPIGETLDPPIDAAVRALHSVWLSPDAVCGVQVPDGRQFILIQAETSHAEGSVPYVFAFDPSWTSKYLAQGDNAQMGAQVFYGKPDRVLRSVMASAVEGCVNLRADLGLDPNGTDTGVAPPPPPDVPGVPSDTVCAHLPAPASAPQQTQLALNEAAGDQALRDGCKARAAYGVMQKRLAKDQAASLRLRATQQAWVAYVDAHEKEYYSHADDRSYYGSMFPMCENGLQDTAAVERAKELKAEKACASPDTRASSAEQNALKTAEAGFVAALASVKKLRAKEPLFLRALERAQLDWATYANAQVALAGARDGGGDYSCGVRELTRLMQARTKALIELAQPPRSGCDAN